MAEQPQTDYSQQELPLPLMLAPILQPRWAIQPAPAIMLFMIGWLVACLVGLVEVLGFGSIANAAHLGGLLSGAALGALFGALSRMGGNKT